MIQSICESVIMIAVAGFVQLMLLVSCLCVYNLFFKEK